MAILLLVTTIFASLTGFALAAARWGVDSRPALPDDHRPTA